MDVVMPQLGETVAEGTIATWFKAVGETVAAGENLFEIETDKVTMEVQALEAGVLAEVRVRAGETAPVGTVVAVIGGAAAAAGASGAAPPRREQGGDGRAIVVPAAASGSGGPVVGNPLGAGALPFAGFAPFAETRTPAGRFGEPDGPGGIKMTPLARRLIAHNGLDVAAIAAAARARGAGRIGKADVESALVGAPAATSDDLPPRPTAAPGIGGQGISPPLAARPAPAAAPKPATRVPLNAARRQTGTRLVQSWTSVPHVFQATEVDFGAVEAVRQARKEAFRGRHGVGLTYLPFIARAVCLAVADYPQVNARLDGDALEIAAEVNLGIAVDLAHNGLVVPVVRRADEMNLAGLAKAVARLVEAARAGRLAPDDFAHGTYTISNNGAFGTLFTAPIVNPPQVAILSTDAVRKKPVVVETAHGDLVAVRPVGVVAQSFDHRAFDGAYSAAYLGRLKSILETRDWAAELG